MLQQQDDVTPLHIFNLTVYNRHFIYEIFWIFRPKNQDHHSISHPSSQFQRIRTINQPNCNLEL